MSNIALTWAQSQVTGSPISKLILFKLADQANDDGVCWPSQSTIAEHCEVGRETVNRHLRRLAEAGLIRVEKRFEDGRKVPNVYRLNLKGYVTESHIDVTDNHRVCDSGSHTYVTEDHIEPSRRTLNEPKREKPLKRKPETEIPEDLELTDAMLTYCQQKAPGTDPYYQFEKFCSHHQAKGSRFRSWEAAWRTWVLNAAKWAPPQPTPPQRISLEEAMRISEERAAARRHH